MLRDYEILYIVRPDLDDDQVHEAVGSVDRLIANLGGATVKTDIWGRRRLAYEVRHLREGQYVLTDFRIEPTRVPEMEATLKISDTVFRHLIVRKPEKTGRAKKTEAAAKAATAATEEAAAKAATAATEEAAAKAATAATEEAAAEAATPAATEEAPAEAAAPAATEEAPANNGESVQTEPEAVPAAAAAQAEEAEEEE